MAINLPNFLNAPLIGSPIKDVFESALKGYQMQQEPAKMAEEQKQRQLANQLKGLEAEHKPKEFELTDKQKELTNAMKEKANAHYEENFGLNKRVKEAQIKNFEKQGGLKGALANAYAVRNNLDSNSPTYEKDLTRVNNYIDRLGMGKDTGINGIMNNEPIKISLPGGKEGYISPGAKLPTGWQAVNDAQGKVQGYNVPMTPDMQKQWKGKVKFDVIYPFMNKSLSYYTGKGSWENFTKDVRHYANDPEAKQRIDNYLAAKNLTSIGATTENARIGGHATNAQLKELKKTLDSSEVYKKLEGGRGLALPQGYAENSGNIFNNYMNKVEEASKLDVPPFEYKALNRSKNSVNLDLTEPETPKVENNVNGKEQSDVNALPDIGTVQKSADGKNYVPVKISGVNGGNPRWIPESEVDAYILDHQESNNG